MNKQNIEKIQNLINSYTYELINDETCLEIKVSLEKLFDGYIFDYTISCNDVIFLQGVNSNKKAIHITISKNTVNIK